MIDKNNFSAEASHVFTHIVRAIQHIPTSYTSPDEPGDPPPTPRPRFANLVSSRRAQETDMNEIGVLPAYQPDTQNGEDGDGSQAKTKTSTGTLTHITQRQLEPVGPGFLAYARRKRHGRTFSEDDRIQAQSKIKKVEKDDSGEISEPEDPIMLSREAKDWKNQDHYAVLGLSKYRYKATPDQIKEHYRKKVLRHHPDKKEAGGGGRDDNFFKCIQRANETLTDPVKRRQFDSVDEEADVPQPTKKEVQKRPEKMFEMWGKVWEAEARFSNIHPVPSLGDDDSTEDEVKQFYDFWYNFNSWRSFEYLDEDVPDDNEARDHKRHVEKKNANQRRKKKTEETARLRKLVDDCFAMDDRMTRFRKQNKANKNKNRTDREAAAKKEAEDKQKAKVAEEAQKKQEEEAAKSQKEADKKAKDVAKNAVKKNRRVVKTSVKDVDYFAEGEADAARINAVLDDTDKMLTKMDPDDLAELVSKLNVAGKDKQQVFAAFSAEGQRLMEAGKAGANDFKTFKA